MALEGVWQCCRQCEGKCVQYQIARFVSCGYILASPVASPPEATRECLSEAPVALSAAVG